MKAIFIFPVAQFCPMGPSVDKVGCQAKHLLMLIGTFHVKLYQLLFLYIDTVSQDEKIKESQ